MNLQDLLTSKDDKKKDDKKMLAVKLAPKVRDALSTICKKNKIKQADFITACINDGIARFEQMKREQKKEAAAA